MKIDASLGERWLAERLGDYGGLVSGCGQRGITISYGRPDRGHVILWRRRRQKEKLTQIARK